MKKIIGLLLTLTMAFSLFTATPVSAYSDITNREDIEVLSDLGIIDGFEDGTYRAEEDLTRAQLVKIICVLMGYEDMPQGNTSYSDVLASHWASGYISQADALDIVAGYEDGTFRPDQKVTYEEAVKMVVCALKYEPAVSVVGSGNWYNGYLNIASSLGITKGVSSSVGMNITRGDMTRLIYNALTIQMLDVESWGIGTTEWAKSEDTILSKYLEIEKWEGILSYTPYMSYMNGSVEGEVKLADAAYITYDGAKDTTETFQIAKCDKDVEDLLGKKIVCYVGEDSRGDWRVFSIAEKDNYNSVMLLKASDIETADADYVYYENANGKTAKIKLSDEVTYIENYDEVATFAHDKANGYITFISNNGDNVYDYVIYLDYTVVGSVVKDIETYDDVIAFDAEDIEEYDYEDDDVLTIVIKDNEVASIEDIEIGDTISAVTNSADTFRLYFVSSKTVEGQVTGLNTDEHTLSIDREDYNVNAEKIPSLNAFTLSDSIVAYFNIDDEIVDFETDDITVSKYGMIIKAYTSSDEEEYKIEAIGTNGTKTVYTVAEKRADDIKALLKEKLGFADGIGKLTYENAGKAIFAITTRSSDGVVTRVTSAATDRATAVTNKTYDEETMTFGPIDISSSTVLFSVEGENVTDIVKAENVTVGAAVNFFTDDEGEEFSLYPLVPRNEIYSIIVGKNITGTVSHKNDAFIIASVSEGYLDSEDDKGYIVTGLQGGKEVTYELFDCAKPEKGMIILLGAKENGVITKYDALIETTEDGYTLVGSTATKVEEYYGKVNRDKTDSTRLYLDDANAPAEGILMKSSANYTLVDCTGSKITVEKKTKGISIFGSADKYESYAYVRYYDDTQTEIVVYRFNK